MTISIKIITKRFYIERLNLYAKMMIPIAKKYKISIIKKFNKICSKMLMY